MGGMRLPEQFLTLDEYLVRGGVEYGFMSATSDKGVALHYASQRDPGVLFEIQQGMAAGSNLRSGLRGTAG